MAESESKSKLERAMEEFRSFRRSLSPASESIFNAGVIGRLLAHIPEEKAIEAIHQSILAWENQRLIIPRSITPDNQEKVYAQIQ